ncbi:MAG: 30S ribosomal protein S20 [Chitinivibrionales bacterium]|nr:30S ribosomal protein S20 [Chitinivibrionales bacterium]
MEFRLEATPECFPACVSRRKAQWNATGSVRKWLLGHDIFGLSSTGNNRSRLMPHHKACAKHLRASIKRNTHNRAARSRLRTALKQVRQASEKGEAETALKRAFSVIDKSAKTGLIHRNNAANQKSRLTRHVAKMGS